MDLKKALFFSAIFVAWLYGCGRPQPQPVKLNTDNCDHCKMTISDLKFASELITGKGRVYKFDDIHCLIAYTKANNATDAALYVSDFNDPQHFIVCKDAFYAYGGAIKSPMDGNTAAFGTKSDAEAFASKMSATLKNWADLNK